MSGWTDALVKAQYDKLKRPPAEAEIQLCITCAGACDKNDLTSYVGRCSECRQYGLVWVIPTVTPAAPAPAPAKAKGRLPWQPKMNATERAYDAYLLVLHVAGEVRWWGFEVVTILLGPDCRFTPDFLVLFSDGRLELHDTKGARKLKTGKHAGEKTYYAEEDATIKARITAARFPVPIYFVWSLGDKSWGKKGFGE